jgi:methionyl-tRNA formyltransferase
MSKIAVLQLAYGEMAAPVLTALAEDGRFEIPAIVTPPVDEALYRRAARLPQEALAESLGAEIVRTGSLKALHEAVARIRPDLVLIATFSRIIPEETLAPSPILGLRNWSSGAPGNPTQGEFSRVSSPGVSSASIPGRASRCWPATARS